MNHWENNSIVFLGIKTPSGSDVGKAGKEEFYYQMCSTQSGDNYNGRHYVDLDRRYCNPFVRRPPHFNNNIDYRLYEVSCVESKRLLDGGLPTEPSEEFFKFWNG